MEVQEKSIAERIKGCFEKKGWRCQWDEGRQAFMAIFKSDSQLGAVHITVNVAEGNYLIKGSVDFVVQEGRRREMAVYVNLVNCTKAGVALQVDMAHGWIKCRYMAFCAPDGFRDSDFYCFLNTILVLYDDYGDGILDVAYGGLCAEEAFLKAQDRIRARSFAPKA